MRSFAGTLSAPCGIFVVLATREREELLARTLTSLAQCRRPAGFAGTFVVENGTRGDTERVVREAAAPLEARYLFEPAGNKSRALNTALAQIDDGLVIFLDDDVRLTPEVLELYATAARGGAGTLLWRAGRARLRSGAARMADRLSAAVGPPAGVPTRRSLTTKPFFLGFNWAAFAGDLRRAGGFDERLGPGTDVGIGDESDLQRRLAAAGVTADLRAAGAGSPLGAAAALLAGVGAPARVPKRRSARVAEGETRRPRDCGLLRSLW